MIPGLVSLFYRSSSGGMSAFASPTSTIGAGSGTTNSNDITATPSGGTAPYTYLWSVVAGDPGASFTASTSATTKVQIFLNPGDNLLEYVQCKVTDASSRVAYTNVVTVNFYYA